MKLAEGLTIFHLIAAILGIILFLTALVLLIRSAIKTNTYPKTLIVCLVIGGMLEVFPVTKKFEANSLISDIGTLTEKLKTEPTNLKMKQELQKKIQKVERWNYRSTKTQLKLNKAAEALR